MEKKKQTVKTIDLPIVATVIRMSKETVNLYMEQEVAISALLFHCNRLLIVCALWQLFVKFRIHHIAYVK